MKTLINSHVNSHDDKEGIIENIKNQSLDQQEESMKALLALIQATAQVFNNALLDVVENIDSDPELSKFLSQEVTGVGDCETLKDVVWDVATEEMNTTNLSEGYNKVLFPLGLPETKIVTEDHYQFLERQVQETRNHIYPALEIFPEDVLNEFQNFSPAEKLGQLAVGEEDPENYYASMLQIFNSFDPSIQENYLYLKSFILDHISLDDKTTEEHVSHGDALIPTQKLSKNPKYYTNHFKTLGNYKKLLQQI